ncbi:MAG TPA: type II toxin-antitoxin system PemK/MazF family toxin [Rhizomicrobium sp.]|jgi:mRNA interferase MazF|nr:type II toxin-antitoxin system PemK/MazF family toxin [Rhizomicrobium sp.]
MTLPERGSIVWLEFSPHAGHEQAGRRPAIVLTPRAYHELTHKAVVCPITSRERGWPMEVKLPAGLPVSGVVLVDEIRSVDRDARHMKVAGAAPQDVLDEIDAKLAPFLSL